MKGVILTGGLGTRLHPLTHVTNKHLLPVYDKPMIYHALNFFVASGIRDILIVCGGNSASDFLRVLGNGESFGLRCLHYRYQSEPRGIADALGLAEEWAGIDPITVLLGDNIFENTCKDAVDEFEANPVGAVIFGTRVEHPEHYGVIMQNAAGKVTKIIEKPKKPKSNLIATGLYMYDNTVWDFIKDLTPSARGELEITDVNNHYLEKGHLRMVELQGYWADCGENLDGYLDACIRVREFSRT